jgi:hypothetical protein
LQLPIFEYTFFTLCGIELQLFAKVHIEIRVGLELIKETPLYANIEISRFYRFQNQIDPLSSLGLDCTLQGLYPYLALFELRWYDLVCAILVALIDYLQFFAEKFI